MYQHTRAHTHADVHLLHAAVAIPPRAPAPRGRDCVA